MTNTPFGVRTPPALERLGAVSTTCLACCCAAEGPAIGADSPPEGGGAAWPPVEGADGAGACATSMPEDGVGELCAGELDIVAVDPDAPAPGGAALALPAPVARMVRSCSSSSAFLRSSNWLLRSSSR